MISIEQVVNTQKMNAEFLFALNSKAFEGFEKLVSLNVEATKAALEELADISRSALTAKSAEEVAELRHRFLEPAAENAAPYTRQVQEIAQETWAGLAEVAVKSVSQSPERLSAFVTSAFQNAPAGTENAVEIIKSTVTGATSAYEGMQKAASDVLGANMQALAAAGSIAQANGKSKAADRRANRVH